MKTRREEFQTRQLGFPRRAGGGNVRTILIGRAQDIFERDRATVKEPLDGAHGDGKLLLALEAGADFCELQIGLLADEIEQLLLECFKS